MPCCPGSVNRSAYDGSDRSATRTCQRRSGPIGRVSNRKAYKLGAWLKAIQRHAGRFNGLNAASLLEVLAKLDEDRAEELRDDEPRDAGAFAFLLMDIASIADVDPAWAAMHAGWIYTDDHRWDRDLARQTLPSKWAGTRVR